MTQGLIMFFTSLIAFVLVDPFFAGGLTKAGLAKLLVLIFGFGCLIFHCFARAVVSPQRFSAAAREVLADWWPLLLLSSFVVGGSVYARVVDDIRESFLNVGLGMLFLPLFALAVRSSETPMAFMKWIAAVYVLMVLGTMPVLGLQWHDFHESIFIVVPLGAYLICSREFSLWKVVLGLTLIGLCAFSVKNTTFLLIITAVLACGGIWLARLFKPGNGIVNVLAVLVIVPLLLAGAGALGYAWWNHREVLPSGNVEYRNEMYSIAWRTFLDSPIWGSAFTDASVVYFSLFQVGSRTQFLPTHSDVLDMLAHGGALAIVLLVAVWWRLFSIGWPSVKVLVRRDPEVDLRPYQWMLVMFLIQIGGFITCAINPVWISPVYAFWAWGCAGVMWALHKELTGDKLPVRLTHRAMIAKMITS